MGIDFIKVNGIPDFELVSGKSTVNTFPVHVHDKYCIGIVRKGNAVFVHKSVETSLVRGLIYLINPGEPHQIKPSDSEGFDHIVLCFGQEFVHQYIVEPGYETVSGSMLFREPMLDNPVVWEGITAFCSAARKPIPGYNAEYGLLELLSLLNPAFSFSNEPGHADDDRSERISKVCDYLKKSVSGSIGLAEMAAYANLSRFHFLREFKARIGISPYEYQIQMRIKTARRMLLEGDSIPRIATELEFSDQSHFTRFFKKNTGVTPVQFVKQNIRV